MSRILLVEDDPTLQETLAYNLRRHGYTVETAKEGWEAVRKAQSQPFDLIVLDVMLPGIDGFEVCRIVRRESSTPILMLTARSDEVDKVVGLEIGADDYMTKPFSLREFLARVKALLRRVRLTQEEMRAAATAPTPTTPDILTFGDLTIDTRRHEVRRNGELLHLTPREFDLLLYLARHRGQVLTREQIVAAVWGWEADTDSRTLNVHIRWLREKIEPDPTHPVRLVTVRGVGYRFEG